MRWGAGGEEMGGMEIFPQCPDLSAHGDARERRNSRVVEEEEKVRSIKCISMKADSTFLLFQANK